MHFPATLRFHLFPTRMARKQRTRNTDRDTGLNNCQGDVNSHSQHGNQYGSSSKTRFAIPGVAHRNVSQGTIEIFAHLSLVQYYSQPAWMPING